MQVRYKYRIYPKEQERQHLAQVFGCCRYVWNNSLAYCNELYAQGQNKPSYNDLSKRLTEIKKTTPWLKEVSSTPLQQSIIDLETAYKNFFDSCSGKRKGPKLKSPKFKSRKSRQSARFMFNNFSIDKQGFLRLTKVNGKEKRKPRKKKSSKPQSGRIEVIWSRPLPSEPKSVTIIKDASGRYFASFVVETQAELLDLRSISRYRLGNNDICHFKHRRKDKCT